MAILIFQHGARQIPGRLGKTLRNLGAQLQIVRIDQGEPVPALDTLDEIDGVIVLGGDMNVTDTPQPAWMAAELAFIKAAHERLMPLVGICLGCQMIAAALGGAVAPAAQGEYGMVAVNQHPIANTDIVLAGVPWKTWQFQSHAQEVTTLPPGATLLQSSAACKVQSYRIGLRTYAFQYHFECDLPMIRQFDRASGGKCAAGVEEHYDRFATSADRLCENIALYLMPVGRAVGAVMA